MMDVTSGTMGCETPLNSRLKESENQSFFSSLSTTTSEDASKCILNASSSSINHPSFFKLSTPVDKKCFHIESCSWRFVCDSVESKSSSLRCRSNPKDSTLSFDDNSKAKSLFISIFFPLS